MEYINKMDIFVLIILTQQGQVIIRKEQLQKNYFCISQQLIMQEGKKTQVTQTCVNINDQICKWDLKPSRQCYETNRNHKARCLKKYTLLDYQFGTKEEGDKTYHYFNFKKTNGRKYKFSCGGYGGTCQRCKCNYNEGKTHRKWLFQCNEDSNYGAFCLKSTIVVK